MGSGLAGDVHAPGLGPADQVHALLCGDVADVVGAAAFLCERQVPFYLAPLALRADALVAVEAGVFTVVDVAAAQQGVVLAVGGKDAVLRGNEFHCLAHNVFILHAAAIVREGHAAALEGLHVHHLKALAAHGDGGVRPHVDDCVPADQFQLLLKVLRAVRGGGEVGHRAHGGVSAGRSRHTPAQDGLLVGKTGLAEVYVHVRKGGNLYYIL